MKIVFFRHSLLSRGGDKMVTMYANHLSDRGHDVSIWTNKVETVFRLSPLVRINKIPWRGRSGSLIWALFRKIKGDIIIADIIIMASLLRLRNGNRVIYYAQDYDVSYYGGLMMQSFIKAVYFLGLSLLKIPCIAVAESLRSELLPFSRDITVVSNGVDFTVFFPEHDAELLRSKEGRKAVLVFSREDPRKGFGRALKVLASLPAEWHEALEIWVVGEQLRERSSPFSMRYFGYVNQQRLRRLLSSADVLLYPSRHEGLSLFILEALRCGCPIVTTTAVTIVRHMREGYVSDVDDDESLRSNLLAALSCDNHELVERGQALAGMFDLEKQKKLFEQCLTDLRHKCNG